VTNPEDTAFLLICPQVSPYSPPPELLAWIAELEADLPKYRPNSQPAQAIQHAIDQARHWLEEGQR
jgi:hypothetical protein